MAKQTINIGTSANDGTGSTLRAAFDITNDNFTELYDGTGGLLHKIEGTNFTGSLLIGHSTTGTLSSAEYNTGVGINALDNLTTGDQNVAIGYAAGGLLQSGSNNIAIGFGAGDALTSGGNNVAIGTNALSTEDTTGNNVAVGTSALKLQDSGSNAHNVAVGYQAGEEVTTGTKLTIIGGQAGVNLTTGNQNIAIGYRALHTEDEGKRTVAIGVEALKSQDASTLNAHNVAVGYQTGEDVTTGRNNTLIGALAGNSGTNDLTTGDNNIIIGYNAAASAVDVSNEVTIGDSNISTVRIPSDSTLKIGASGDLQLEHLSSNSFIKNTAVGDLYIENQVDDADVIFRSDDGSGGLATYFSLDGGEVRTIFARGARFNDSIPIELGGSADAQIQHDGTDTKFVNATGDLILQNSADDKDIIFKSDDGSGGVTNYLKLWGAIESLAVYKDMLMVNDGNGGKLKFGASQDLQMYHDGSDSYVQQTGTGDLILENTTDDKDIKLKSDDGSGGTEIYINVDGSARATKFVNPTFHNDSVKAKFGSDGDLEIYHNATDSIILNGTGDLYIANATDDKDIIFQSDDGSGGLTTYFFLDGSGTNGSSVTGATVFPDASKIYLGTGKDMEIFHNGSQAYIENYTGEMNFTQHVDDGDMIFKCDDGSGSTTEYFRVDGGDENVLFSKILKLSDNVELRIGGGNDIKIYHDTSNSYIKTGTEAGNLIIEQNTDDADIIFKCDDGSGGVTEYLKLDGGDTRIKIPDNINMTFGAGGDLQLSHDATDSLIRNYTGDLKITNFADDKDINFLCDDGSGGTATYFRVDGSEVETRFLKSTLHFDNVVAKYGDGGDLQIVHNGTDTQINNTTGNLQFTQLANDKDISFASDNGSGGDAIYFFLDGSQATAGGTLFTKWGDNSYISLGDGSDLYFFHNGTDTKMQNQTGDLVFEQSADDKDIIFKTDDGSGGLATYFTVDGANEVTSFQKHTKHEDSVVAYFGNGSDLQIAHNATDSTITNTTGNIDIIQNADDKDIILRCDNGSGGNTPYITLDGSDVSTSIQTIKVLMPNLPTSDPSVAGQLYTDSGVLKVSAG